MLHQHHRRIYKVRRNLWNSTLTFGLYESIKDVNKTWTRMCKHCLLCWCRKVILCVFLCGADFLFFFPFFPPRQSNYNKIMTHFDCLGSSETFVLLLVKKQVRGCLFVYRRCRRQRAARVPQIRTINSGEKRHRVCPFSVFKAQQMSNFKCQRQTCALFH